MLFTIITVNFNNKEGLQKTLQSVISQTFCNFEWVIIDGGSADGSKDLLEQYSDKITYWCSEKDNGIYQAMNKGIKSSHGEYLLFLNSGDILKNNTVVENVLPYLKEYDFIVGNVYLSSDFSKNMVKDKMFTNSGVVWVLNQFAYPHQGTFINRNVFYKYGFYREDKRISSDWWLCYKALILGEATIKYIPCDISIYDANGISSKNRNLMIEEREILLKKRPYLYEMYRFYNDNIDIIQSIKSNVFVFFLFRIYFRIYRLFIR